MQNEKVVIGVLALQGGFLEHISHLKKIEGVVTLQVKTPKQLEQCDGLIVPGGESTALSLIALKEGFMEPLKNWTKDGKPTWGTCAGLIMIADRITREKIGGQTVIGGLDITVERNHFGSQLDSFEQNLKADKSVAPDGKLCRCLFIRAPMITNIGKDVKVLMTLNNNDDEIVAVTKDYLLGTCFHPELAADLRWHKFFVDIVRKSKNASKSSSSNTTTSGKKRKVASANDSSNNNNNVAEEIEIKDEYDPDSMGHKLKIYMPVIDKQ